LIKGLLILLLLAQPLRALRRRDDNELDAGRLRRAQANIQQLLFGQAALREARRHLGEPYQWGGKNPDEGFDCSGYTQYVFKTLGVELASNAMGQYQKGIPMEKPALMPGDLVFFASSSAPIHVGIYSGEGKFLHAPATGQVIREADMEKGYFASRYIGARRYVPRPASVQSPTTKEEKKP
jgi:hypothetical protein